MFMSVTWVSCIRFLCRFAWALGESLVCNELSLLFPGAVSSHSETAVTGMELKDAGVVGRISRHCFQI